MASRLDCTDAQSSAAQLTRSGAIACRTQNLELHILLMSTSIDDCSIGIQIIRIKPFASTTYFGYSCFFYAPILYAVFPIPYPVPYHPWGNSIFFLKDWFTRTNVLYSRIQYILNITSLTKYSKCFEERVYLYFFHKHSANYCKVFPFVYLSLICYHTLGISRD